MSMNDGVDIYEVFKKLKSEKGKKKGLKEDEIIEWMRDSDILKSKKSIRKFINKMVERSLLSQIENDGNILYTFKADGEYENSTDSNPLISSDDSESSYEAKKIVMKLRAIDNNSSTQPQRSKIVRSKSYKKKKSKKFIGNESKEDYRLLTSDDELSMKRARRDIEFNKLIDEVQNLAHDIRSKLNSLDFSSLISSIVKENMEKIKRINSDIELSKQNNSAEKLSKKTLNLSKLNKLIDSDLSSFDSLIESIRSETNTNSMKKIITILKDIRSQLKHPFSSYKDRIKLLENEEIVWKATDICDPSNEKDDFYGQILLSNYRFIYVRGYDDHIESFPLAYISSFSKLNEKKHFNLKIKGVEIITKDQRIIRVGFKSKSYMRNEFTARLKSYIANMPLNLFCWVYSPQNLGKDGWNLYKIKNEFKRIGVDENSQWRYTNINHTYELCDTYPKTIIVPNEAEDDLLISVSNYRSRRRIPILSWLHKNGASITRCSQPAVGMSRKRCKDDEALIQMIYKTNPYLVKNEGKFLILDARPKANAVGNTALGYGYELIQHYKNCTITFCNIENIHVIRSSHGKLLDSIYDEDGKWFTNISLSEWFYHLYLLLCTSYQIADNVHNKNISVLVHCSDGWDRTAQLVSIAQIMLDPYYRTIEGFCILIEKEWLTVGHRFSLRHGTDGTNSNERSPIFHQFIEAVWHFKQQLKSSLFEFNDNFLIDLLDEVYALRFGTFMYDNEKEREENELKKRTFSLWDYILKNKDKYINQSYIPNDDVIIYRVTDKKMKIWEDYYFRHHPSLKRRE